MDSRNLREKFIKFFEGKNHKLVAPASLIPENDPSVLFTTAGMQQFKRFYTNPEEAPAKNIVTCQPCIRTSDIDNVGDETHLTFLEMLGNFSFGGYFKKEAIEWGYEFLTDELDIEPERITSTIFSGDDLNSRDDESAGILESMRLKYKEYSREDNFWGPTGDEGPCGPTVEFYIDGIEVWNLVFNEYYKEKDGSYRNLQTIGIDTGMGLERMLVALNKKNDVFQTDLFWSVIQEIERLTDLKYGSKSDIEYIKDNKQCWVDIRKKFRIIADHVRATAFISAEKIEVANTGRGYIVRRLIRRATRRSKSLGMNQPFLVELADVFIKSFSTYYPILKEEKDFIRKNLIDEEQKFQKPLDWVDQYREDLEAAQKDNIIKKIKDIPILLKPGVASGEYIYENFQTYGVPPDLSKEVAKELRLEVDQAGFDNLYKKHQEISRSASARMFKGGLVGQTEITTRMHTATHILLKALQEVLGPEVHQRGSNINEERIRFDFSYPKALTNEQVKKVESIVNEKIRENISVVKRETTVEEAKSLGAEAQFVDKYIKYGNLTMYSIGEYSHELCGGPHVKSAGEIGKFKIIKEESSSAGIRRIRAILESLSTG
ncbi:MAG: alanyl-tRNA synthetase AlaRS [Candidatus Berkelbacteria bacterium]|nr:alanyl-tRNA synthetase AlaRS [Candidatus Berkelbacteria bacterium]